jgi:hypothetical protein
MTTTISGSNPAVNSDSDALINSSTLGRGNGNLITNSVFGNSALSSNTTGQNDIAIGQFALLSNTTGNYNVGIGWNSLGANTTGSGNIGIGTNALPLNTTADNNVAVGTAAMQSNTTGTQNCGMGTGALQQNTTGNFGVAVGVLCLAANTSGFYNVGVGHGSGGNVTTGSNNTLIGYQAGIDAVANITTQSNYVVMGNNNTTNANIKVAWTVTSDARDKTNILPVAHGLDFVSKLNPVSYQFVDDRINKKAVGDVKYGFLAQDILALEGNNPVVINNKDAENLKYNGESLVPILVKAVQELSAKVIALEAKLGKQNG